LADYRCFARQNLDGYLRIGQTLTKKTLWWMPISGVVIVLAAVLVWRNHCQAKSNNALISAIEQCNTDEVERLLASGADVNARKPAILFGSNPGNLRTWLRQMFTGGGGRSHQGPTALMVAARTGEPAIIRVLLARGADARATSAGGATCLSYTAIGTHQWNPPALVKNQTQVIKMLEKAGGVWPERDPIFR
jgi:hypothetical protein